MTSASLKAPAVPLPSGLRAQFLGRNPNLPCTVLATRSFDGPDSIVGGEFLITYELNRKPVAQWVEAGVLQFAA